MKQIIFLILLLLSTFLFFGCTDKTYFLKQDVNGGLVNFGDLNNVDLTGLDVNQVVKWSGNYWIPSDDNSGGGGTTSPAGANKQIQFNDSGVFGADANFVWDKTNNRLGINSTSPQTSLQVGGVTTSSGYEFRNSTTGTPYTAKVISGYSIYPHMTDVYSDMFLGKPVTKLEFDINGYGGWIDGNISDGQKLFDARTETNLNLPYASYKGFRVTFDAGSYLATQILTIEQLWKAGGGSDAFDLNLETSLDGVTWSNKCYFTSTTDGGASVSHYYVCQEHTANTHWRITIRRKNLTGTFDFSIYNIKMYAYSNLSRGVVGSVPYEWDYNLNLILASNSRKFMMGSENDSYLVFDGDSLNVVANNYVSTDDLEITADDVKINADVGIGLSMPTGKLDVNGKTLIRDDLNVNGVIYGNASGLSIYADGNVSAAGYITRTEVYDKSRGSALSFIKDASDYLTLGKADDSKFSYSKVTYDKKVISGYEKKKSYQTVCKTLEMEVDLESGIETGETNYVCEEVEIINQVPIYKTITETGVSLDKENALLKQALYELKKCIIDSKDYVAMQECVK